MNDNVQIQAVTFGDGTVEITFVEPRDIGDLGLLAKTAVIHITEDLEQEAQEVAVAVQELLDRWLVLRRAPTPSFKGRARP